MSEDEQITLPKPLLQAVFDIAIGSMDFGSGFLDDEEQEHLRALAVALGVDPMVATQRNYLCKYRGSHEWRRQDYSDARVCIDCKKHEETIKKGDRVRLKDGREVLVFADDGETLRVVDLRADSSFRINRYELAPEPSQGGSS